MAKFRAYGLVVGSKCLGEIEADTMEEARRKAWELAHVSLCHACDEECESAEIDDITIEVVEPSETAE